MKCILCSNVVFPIPAKQNVVLVNQKWFTKLLIYKRYYFVLLIGTEVAYNTFRHSITKEIQHSLHSRGRKVLCGRRVHSVVVALKSYHSSAADDNMSLCTLVTQIVPVQIIPDESIFENNGWAQKNRTVLK